MDFIGDLINQMSSAFNQEKAIPKKEEISMDETLKWRALKNNQFASRPRLQTQQQQQVVGGGPADGTSGTRTVPANGGRKGTVAGTGPGGPSNGQRQRALPGGDGTDNSIATTHENDGSRSSPIADNGSLTSDVGDEEDIEIEIAKDISGEELKEALGLSQLIEVEPEDLGASLDIGHSDAEEQDRKSTPIMEKDQDEKETIVRVDCKPVKEQLDTKSPLEVPYCSSASVSPALMVQEGVVTTSDQILLPVKCDVDAQPDVQPLETTEPVDVLQQEDILEAASTVSGESSVHPAETVTVSAAVSVEFGPGRVEQNGEEKMDGLEGTSGLGGLGDVENDGDKDISTSPHMECHTGMDDDEDDVLIITTDSVDEVVELAETSKEDDDDNEDESTADHPEEEPSTVRTEHDKPDVEQNEQAETDAPDPAVVVVAIPTENVPGALEEKFRPPEAEPALGDRKSDETTTNDDHAEVKFSDTLKEPGSPETKVDLPQATTDEKREPMIENKQEDTHVTGALAAGRTTRSRKGVTVTPSPPVASAAVTHSQRRSQRFQKDPIPTPIENATEPTIVVVKEEDPDEELGAKKRPSTGGATVGDGKLAAPGSKVDRTTVPLKSDRSLRSKHHTGSGTVMTRRASETVKVTPTEDSNDSNDVDTTDRSSAGRRGRKRLSQDRGTVLPNIANDSTTRTREKVVREEPAAPIEQPTKSVEVPQKPEPAQQAVVVVQQSQPQRRGRKRKNPNSIENGPAAAGSTTGPSGAAGSGGVNAEKPPLHPYKRAARQSRDGSDGILASALARRDKVDSQGRLSRPIKLSAKILANEELRQGFEQHNNGRIIITSEHPVAVVQPAQNDDFPGPPTRDRDEEPERSRKQGQDVGGGSIASCSTIGSSSEDITLVSVTLAAPKTAKVPSSGGAAPEKQYGRKAAEPFPSRMVIPRRTPKPVCPDVQTFLQEVRTMRLGSNRSPEENRKLNRRQLKRLGKLKEKHLMALGLQRRGTHQPRNGGDGKDSDVELSAGESESSGSEADFVPPQKIGTVGKPSVTLRLRKPETLLEHPAGRGRTGASQTAIASNGSTASRPGVNTGRQVGGKQPNSNANSRRSSSAVVLPAAMTTVNSRAPAAVVPGTSNTGGNKDRETEQLQRSLQRLGCEVTLIPTTTRGDGRPAAPSNRAGTSWPVRRVKETVGGRKVPAPTPPSSVVGSSTTSPGLEIVLEKRPGVSSPPLVCIANRAPDKAAALSVHAEKLVCLCRQRSDIFVASTVGSGYCTAVDDIDGQQIGCCNELENDLLNMLRPSATVSFQLLCNMHRQRLEDHGCCAVCGTFCTQGYFAMCKSAHVFHAQCADKYTLNTPYNPARPADNAAPTLILKCPHCGQECPNGEIQVRITLTAEPLILPSRESIVKPAKMTVAKSGNSDKGDGGSSDVNDRFRATVESLVPNSVKNMLAKDRGNANATGGSATVGVPGGTGKSVTAKDVVGGSGGFGTRNRFTTKDFSHAVCTKKDDARVSEIITAGFDIETRFREFHYGTCLHVVSNFGTLAMAYLIMCRARSLNYVNIVDRELRTAVMCAVLGEKIEIVKLLLDSGADATIKGPYGMTVLHLAAKLGRHEAVRTILECTKQRMTARELMSFVNSVDNGQWTALAWAAENRHKQTVLRLIEIGADVNVCDALNNTSLHWASLSGCPDTLYPLMTKACNPNMQNANGETPLHIACRQGHADICVVLLARGASLNIRNSANELPQDIIEDRNSECANIIAANLKMRSLAKNLKVTHTICSDISNGRERYPVQVVYYTRGPSDRQLAIPNFKYVQSNVQIEYRPQQDSDDRTITICTCKDSCTSADSECLCSKRTWYTNEGRLVSDFNYLDPPAIVECGELCDCNRRLCRNRVVQHGLDVPLQLYYIPGKAWGVRTLVPIPKGTFLIEYVGELLTDEVANHRADDSYLFDLGIGFCIDASAYGNVSRFFNHSCQPNVSPVSVYYDQQNHRFPRVALFACRDIDAQEEICFDYGEKFWMVKKQTLVCKCNTAQCRYRTAE